MAWETRVEKYFVTSGRCGMSGLVLDLTSSLTASKLIPPPPSLSHTHIHTHTISPTHTYMPDGVAILIGQP